MIEMMLLLMACLCGFLIGRVSRRGDIHKLERDLHSVTRLAYYRKLAMELGLDDCWAQNKAGTP